MLYTHDVNNSAGCVFNEMAHALYRAIFKVAFLLSSAARIVFSHFTHKTALWVASSVTGFVLFLCTYRCNLVSPRLPFILDDSFFGGSFACIMALGKSLGNGVQPCMAWPMIRQIINNKKERLLTRCFSPRIPHGGLEMDGKEIILPGYTGGAHTAS